MRIVARLALLRVQPTDPQRLIGVGDDAVHRPIRPPLGTDADLLLFAIQVDYRKLVAPEVERALGVAQHARPQLLGAHLTELPQLELTIRIPRCDLALDVV